MKRTPLLQMPAAEQVEGQVVNSPSISATLNKVVSSYACISEGHHITGLFHSPTHPLCVKLALKDILSFLTVTLMTELVPWGCGMVMF